MDSFFITLLEKKQLTEDVYELIYLSPTDVFCLPGQFLLCDTDSNQIRLRRSYSISDYQNRKIHFIIKKLSDGRGGSQAICEQDMGHSMQVWGPSGHFFLPESIKNIIFIGTGTGFAPLYFQAKTLLEHASNISIRFIFGVRTEKDLFYQDILTEWTQKYPNFSYQFCLSQEPETLYFPGRVTEYLGKNFHIAQEPETIFSICGSPVMVKEVREILSSQGIEKERIFFEQY